VIAEDIMTENPRTIRATDSIAEALEALQSMNIRHLPVLDDSDELVGMLSDRDLGPLMQTFVEGVVPPLSNRKVSELMSTDVVSVDPDTDILTVVELMLEQRIGAVPVVDGSGAVTGIISYVDILRTIALPTEEEERIRP
jgi:acetoin utilization protein AcuB